LRFWGERIVFGLFLFSCPYGVQLKVWWEGEWGFSILQHTDDAVDCYLRYWYRPSEQAQALHRESVEWIESSEEEWLCSFISICRAFDIEPSYMRKGLRLRLQEIQAAEHAASMKRAA